MKKEDFKILARLIFISSYILIFTGLFGINCCVTKIRKQNEIIITQLEESNRQLTAELEELKIILIEEEYFSKEQNTISPHNTDVLSIDLSVPLGLTEKELLTIITNTTTEERVRNIAPYVEAIVEASRQTKINELFLTSLIAWESGWASEVTYGNNFYGWKGGNYASLEQSIIDIAHKIKDRYLSENGYCFNGYTLAGINVKYNGSQQWLDGMENIMEKLYESFDFL